MMRVLAAEWIKIRSYRPFWVLSGLAAIIYVIAAWAISKISSIRAELPIPAVLDFPQVWQTYSWIARWMLYFFGFAVIQMVCNEKEFRTDRQNIIDGLSRVQYFFAKWFNAVIPALMTLALIVAVTALFGTGTFSTTGAFKSLSRFAVCALGYGAFAMLLGLVFRRSAAAAFGYVAYPVAIEPLAGMVINHYSGRDIGTYLPFNVFNGLIHSPFSGIQAQLGMTFMPAGLNITLACLYLAALWLFALFVILRRNF